MSYIDREYGRFLRRQAGIILDREKTYLSCIPVMNNR